jgi:uncharacterized protein (TIGR02466 family)
MNKYTSVFEPIFAIPFININWENVANLNQQLTAVILEKKKIEEGIKISNLGGWHSKQDFFTWDAPCIQELREMILIAIKEMLAKVEGELPESYFKNWEIEAWANVNEKGHANASHEHTRNKNQWSGVYYVETGEDGTNQISGETVFEDRFYFEGENIFINHVPSLRVNGKPKAREYKIVPQNGKMVLFPNTLTHRVEPYLGIKTRITIAFNMKHPDFGVFAYSNRSIGIKSILKMALKAKLKRWGLYKHGK